MAIWSEPRRDQAHNHASSTPSQHRSNPGEELDDAVAAALEKQWRASLPRYTDKALLDIFPEAREVIRDKLAEWKQERTRLVRMIKQKLAVIRRRSAPDHRWFWREWVKYSDGPALRKIEAQLVRLRRLHRMATNVRPTHHLTDQHIEQARSVPLDRLVSTPLRQSGKTFAGHCPLHQERTPSFHVYPATNSWYCFGCQRGGDAIVFVRHLHGYSFPEAVRYLVEL